MKKYYLIVIAALFAIATVSCQKETEAVTDNQINDENPVNPGTSKPLHTLVFTAGAPGAPGTKTVLGEIEEGKYKVLWTENDKIAVNGVESNNAVVTEGGLKARFTVESETEIKSPYYVFSPGGKTFTGNEDGTEWTYLVSGAGSPTPQSYVEGTYNPGHAVIAAYTGDLNEELSFQHLCAYYKITVDNDIYDGKDLENIRRIYIRQGDGSKIAGTWKATYSTDTEKFSIEPVSLSNVLVLDCGEEGISHGTPMIIPVPAYNFGNGLIITLKDVSGHFASYSIPSSKTNFAENAGKIYEFKPKFIPKSGIIKNEGDWNAFAEAVNSSNDWDLYRWVGNDTVKLGADIEAANLTKITKEFAYTFDGQDHTIKRTAGTGALFSSISGTVKNLNLAGKITAGTNVCGSLSDNLLKGGYVFNCHNTADITNEPTTYARAGGLVGIMTGGVIEGCSNGGNIYASVDCSSETKSNLQIGGIVAQINVSSIDGSEDIELKNCSNTGEIVADPLYSLDNKDYGIQYVGVGGIAGWLRGNKHSFTFNNCDNSGPVTFSGEHVVSTNGMAAYSISVGGIVGIAGDINTSTSGKAGNYDESIGTNGLDVTMTGCDNSGTVHNCGINYSATGASNNKVYTGGIAGSLVGTNDKNASLNYCSNTGTLLTYDRYGTGASTRPIYSQVAGGLIGYGGFVSIDHCYVNCTIGNGKRQCNALSGAIGFAMRKFEITNSTVWYTGYFARYNNYNQLNSSTFAVVSKQWGYDSANTPKDLAPAPDITGSKIENCSGGGFVYYYNASATSTEDLSGNFSDSKKITLTTNTTMIVRGQGFNAAADITAAVSLNNNSNITEAPTENPYSQE